MNPKIATFGLLAALGLGLLPLAASIASAAPLAQSGNLLTNGSWESGYHRQDGIPELNVPDNWRLWYLDNQTFPGIGSGQVAYRPESVVWPKSQAPGSEKNTLCLDGEWTWKIFKGFAPVYIAVSQDVSGLVVGQTYRFTAPVYADIIEGASKTPPADLTAASVRLAVSPVGATWRDEKQISYGNWWNGANTTDFYFNFVYYSHIFTATSTQMTVWVEMVGRYGYGNNGFFLDNFWLTPLGQGPTFDWAPTIPPFTPTPGGPPTATSAAPTAISTGGAATAAAAPSTATPTPTATSGLPACTYTLASNGAKVHIVAAGETLWLISLACNSTVGEIKSLNGLSADTVFAGQQLIVGYEFTPTPVDTPPPLDAPTPAPGAPEESAPENGGEQAATPAAIGAAPDASVGQICATAFLDGNLNGLRDGDEALVPGAILTLTSAGVPLAAAETAADRNPQCFPNLPTGEYVIAVAPPAGFNPPPAGAQVTVAVGANENLEIPFGLTVGLTAPPGAAASASRQVWLVGTLGIVFLTIALGVGGYLFLRMNRSA